jgi:hypothetical protein
VRRTRKTTETARPRRLFSSYRALLPLCKMAATRTVPGAAPTGPLTKAQRKAALQQSAAAPLASQKGDPSAVSVEVKPKVRGRPARGTRIASRGPRRADTAISRRTKVPPDGPTRRRTMTVGAPLGPLVFGKLM